MERYGRRDYETAYLNVRISESNSGPDKEKDRLETTFSRCPEGFRGCFDRFTLMVRQRVVSKKQPIEAPIKRVFLGSVDVINVRYRTETGPRTNEMKLIYFVDGYSV